MHCCIVADESIVSLCSVALLHCGVLLHCCIFALLHCALLLQVEHCCIVVALCIVEYCCRWRRPACLSSPSAPAPLPGCPGLDSLWVHFYIIFVCNLNLHGWTQGCCQELDSLWVPFLKSTYIDVFQVNL